MRLTRLVKAAELNTLLDVPVGFMGENAQYRMIAIDLDGTLLCPDGTVRPRVKEAIHRVLKAGYVVCFATGRNYTESREVIEAVGHFDHAVFVGGAVIVDTRRGVTLHQQKMEPELARALSAEMEALGHAVLALQDPQGAGADYFVTDGVPLDDSTHRWMAAYKVRLQPVPSLARHDHAHTIRVGIVGPTGKTTEVRKRIEERFAERVVVHSLRVLDDVEVLECFDPSVNKWEGIMHVARRHGIAPSQVVAIGDDFNDLAMIRQAGLGVAMGNARPEVKAQADRVIGANRDEGLAIFLEELAGQGPVGPSGRPGEVAA